MNVKIYKGLATTGEPAIYKDIERYSIFEGRISVMLSGGYPTIGLKYNDICSIEVVDEKNGNISLKARYLSNSFVVYDDKNANQASIIADNTLLFEILEV